LLLGLIKGKKVKKYLLVLALILTFSAVSALSQTRIAILPFQNSTGKIELNKWCYELQDSLQKYFIALGMESNDLHIVPFDTIEIVLAEMNLNPSNPQFASDMWKVVENLHVQYVISGNFIIQAERFLVNTYIYDVSMKLAITSHQARDIFLPLDKILSGIRPIGKKLQGFFLKQ
jgi:TolB-like protein